MIHFIPLSHHGRRGLELGLDLPNFFLIQEKRTEEWHGIAFIDLKEVVMVNLAKKQGL